MSFNKKLLQKINKNPKLKELDTALKIFMETQGFKRIPDKKGGQKIIKCKPKISHVDMSLKLKKIKAYK